MDRLHKIKAHRNAEDVQVKIEVECRINVSGQWWDIVTEHTIPNELTPKDKVSRIEAVIKGLFSTGMIISRIGASPPQPDRQVEKGQAHEQAGIEAVGFTWPIPRCELHGEEMKVSTHQKKEGYSQFFCPLRHGQDYCKHRAGVDMKTGIPKFWEVK